MSTTRLTEAEYEKMVRMQSALQGLTVETSTWENQLRVYISDHTTHTPYWGFNSLDFESWKEAWTSIKHLEALL